MTRSVSSVANDATSSVRTADRTISVSSQTSQASGVGADVAASSDSGGTVVTCIRMFGGCAANSADTASLSASVSVDANTDATVGMPSVTCRGIFRRCDQIVQGAAPIVPQYDPRSDRTSRLGDVPSAMAAPLNGVPFHAAALRGIVLMSTDNVVLGIVQDARWVDDETLQVDVQDSNTIGVARQMATVQFRPVRQPTDRITFGVTARQFAASIL